MADPPAPLFDTFEFRLLVPYSSMSRKRVEEIIYPRWTTDEVIVVGEVNDHTLLITNGDESMVMEMILLLSAKVERKRNILVDKKSKRD